jgi:predicted DNA-binding protein (UPF0251 family)
VKKQLFHYGPNMTPAMKAELEAEIAAFDKDKTLKDLEENAEPKTDAPGYAEWRSSHGIGSTDRHGDRFGAEPDLVSEDDAIDLSSPILSKEVIDAKLEVDSILSYRELQVWRLAMRKGLTRKQTADLLHISPRSVDTYLDRAKAKIMQHFKDGNVE